MSTVSVPPRPTVPHQVLISAQHTEEDIDRYLATVDKFAQALGA